MLGSSPMAADESSRTSAVKADLVTTVTGISANLKKLYEMKKIKHHTIR